MGIDIYAKWRNQTEEEHKSQITGFSVEHGNVGYLREAYHGEPYVTHFLLKEAFEAEEGEAKIPAKILRERLPRALELAKERELKVYKSEVPDQKVLQSFIDFVELCEKKEKETGEAVTIRASY